MTDWISTKDRVPMWENGYFKIKHTNGKEYEGRYNEMGFWWRVPTDDGVLRFEEEEITHFKNK